MDKRFSFNLDDFSLTRGGPFFELLARLGLVSPSFYQPAKRAIFLALFTWLPIFLLSALQGFVFGGPPGVSFIQAYTPSVRFLIAIPLLVIAEAVLDLKTNAVVKHFANSGLVHERDYPVFESAVMHALRLRDSLVAEGLLAALVVIGSAYTRPEFSGSFSTWQVLVSEAGRTRTLAGWWYAVVAIPLFQFLLFRWLWRLLIWTRLLWIISRINLQLMPTHPDRAAGLGFLGLAQAKYGIVILAVSAVVASQIGEEILFEGRSLLEYKFMIAAYVAVVLLLFLGPLLVFTPRLLEVKRRGLLEYGALANEYTQAFDRKWIKGEAPRGEMLIGSADIQSLADLGNSFEYVREMRLVPVDRNSIVPLIASAVLPMVPLVLTMFPLDELLLKILGFLF